MVVFSVIVSKWNTGIVSVCWLYSIGFKSCSLNTKKKLGSPNTKLCKLTGLWSRSRRLGLETYQRLVSVSSREKLSTSRSRLGLGRQTCRSRPFTSRTQGQFSAKLCRSHYTQCEGALDVVSLCCSYYCSS